MVPFNNAGNHLPQQHFTVHACMHEDVDPDVFQVGFVFTITSIPMDGFQNDLAQLFPLMSRCAI